MKLVRWGAPGQEKPGIVDVSGIVRDVSAHVPDFTGEHLGSPTLDRLRSLNLAALPAIPPDTRLGPPVARVWNFIAVGLNYADHAKETGQEIPAEPILFNKLGNSIVGPTDDVMFPKEGSRLDWEVEIAFVVGRRARYVDESESLAHIAGYCVCNDVSERRFQMKHNGQWVKGKSAETFGPLGPWLVTTDEMTDPHKLGLWLDVNGERKQTGNTSTMIMSIPKLLSYITRFMVLEAGDVVTTGTPPGVGSAMKPPQYLQVGDVMSLGIDGLGEQRSRVVAFQG